MCGIVGYVGPGDAAEILLDGLMRLEYRGYDSSGIAVLDEGILDLRRSVGKIGELERILDGNPMKGSIGVGHTRWATHGKPSEENAHPHREDRKSGVEGKSVDLGGRRLIKKKTTRERLLVGRE